MKVQQLQYEWSHRTLSDPQGDQGPEGPPGPFEYVDPPEDLYIKGEQVGGPDGGLCWFCFGFWFNLVS